VIRAIGEYQTAVQLDPRFVEALARLAYGYALIVYYGFSYRDLSPDRVLSLGFASADSALHVDSTAAEAWLARGRFLEVLHPRTYEGAIAAYQRAATLDPRNAEALNMIGTALRERSIPASTMRGSRGGSIAWLWATRVALGRTPMSRRIFPRGVTSQSRRCSSCSTPVRVTSLLPGSGSAA